MKSKRFEVLGNRPVNKDGYVKEYRKWKSYRIRW